ncbi:hypothetical protein HWV62_40822 [Athelia sp. TMB]|nr:hypothetical protein HWV62_40822 [Athelia sp. TMB]
MSRFPLEIWERIFILACTDDGTAGASLSAVSHSFRKASAPYRYYSIGIKSVPSALKFVDLLQRTPREDLPVRHLFITNDPRHLKTKAADDDPETASLGKRALRRLLPNSCLRFFRKKGFGSRRRDPPSYSAIPSPTDFQAIEAIRIILYTLYPTLATLSLSLDFDQLKHLPPLPHLTDLTLTLRTAWPRVVSSVFRALPPLPALRRLDLLGVDCLDPPDRILLDAVTHLPQLTHICLPVVRSTNFIPVALTLGAAMARLEAKKRETVACCPPLWVLVQADPWHAKGGSRWHERHDIWMPVKAWSGGIRAFRECLRDHDWLRIHQRRVPLDICAAEQEAHWVDRLTGGDGCWGLDDWKHGRLLLYGDWPQRTTEHLSRRMPGNYAIRCERSHGTNAEREPPVLVLAVTGVEISPKTEAPRNATLLWCWSSELSVLSE